MVISHIHKIFPGSPKNRNSIHGSAICSFNLSSINAAFAGPFKHQDSMMSAWERKEPSNRQAYECKFNTLPAGRHHDYMIGSPYYQLMDESVPAMTQEPLFVSKLERFTHIALDSIATKQHQQVQIIYVATDTNLVKKLSILPRTSETCVIEVWQPNADASSTILSIDYLKHSESLYIGMDASIVRIPAQHCARHLTKDNCLNAMDPYCGWNDLQQACTPPPDGDPLKRFWIQKSNECPVSSAPMDGGFSAWSEWFKCHQHIDDHRHESSNADSCLCRTRMCNNPSPRNGGAQCKGNDNYIFVSRFIFRKCSKFNKLFPLWNRNYHNGNELYGAWQMDGMEFMVSVLTNLWHGCEKSTTDLWESSTSSRR